MSIYSIKINNESGNDGSFLLFQSPPTPTSSVFKNSYKASHRISGNDSSITFQMSKDCFAIFGTEGEDGGGAVKVSTTSHRAVKLGPGGSAVALTTVDGYPMWDDKQAVGNIADTPGSFCIITDDSFSTPNPDIVPISTFVAEPSTSTTIVPSRKFFVAFGDYKPGTVVNTTILGKVLVVDFSAAAVPQITFTYNTDGTYSSDPSDDGNGVQWFCKE
ncbi:hypothetical protein G7Z17_g4546 [Cylindrodendrum hubeiense]|uniref:Uncharacterized protein n=1 Tax=Cylindrodendrum hubeiense TaxID=595255 RepID=A0A9P5LIT3_9HYPO|nr:hypothetical protein G7Z17_g4546 [Cylindrodendrum hubeiense]